MIKYISRSYYNSTSAGNKAKSDYEDIMAAEGAVNIGLRRTFGDNKALAFVRNLAGVARASLSLRRGDVLVLQYPVKKYFSFLCRVARARGVRVVAFIHDLGTFRRRALTVEKEISRLAMAGEVIAANASMASWLRARGLSVPVYEMGLHDYLSTARPAADVAVPRRKTEVVYAGSLNRRKNSFLADLCVLPRTWNLHIFGDMGDAAGDSPAAVEIHGYMDSDTFISRAGGGFGLVWDGDSLDACTGAFGEYLRYNTPHKASFYLRAGMPLIVWSGSALAPVVRSFGAGLVIDSLRSLDDALASLTDDAYTAMRRAAAALADDIASGAAMRRQLRRISGEAGDSAARL